MKTAILLLLIGLSGTAFAENIPTLNIARIGPAPIRQPEDTRVVVKISNHTNRSFFYSACGRLKVLIQTETKKDGVWQFVDIIQSGSGFEWYELKPGDELDITVTPSPEWVRRIDEPELTYIRYPLRFRFDCRAASGSPIVTHCYSRECDPKEFWKKE